MLLGLSARGCLAVPGAPSQRLVTGGVASWPRATRLACRSGWRRNLSTSPPGPPMQVQSSSYSVDTSHERSAGNIKLDKAPFQNDQPPLWRQVAA
jgi:hypothetical protein